MCSGSSYFTYINTLLLIIFYLLISPFQSASAQTSVISRVFVIISQPDGINEIGLTDKPVELEVERIGKVIRPGEPYTYFIKGDEEIGSRLHYSVHTDSLKKKIVVHSDHSIKAGSLFVEVINHSDEFGTGSPGTAIEGPIEVGREAQDLITGIGRCFTGTQEDQGPLLKYTLSDELLTNSVTVRYSLVEDADG